ncbi:MAG: 50S ribosomal protein L11 methyltransferase [Clostridia bacterium]|mgnify:CR=1 FL=1|nr:50S ribosomal protein L11 methyltransferase [Clostridia bacterium]MDD4572367.1 50S ribosomal protein L11 methyltransferase [Clostridia bacterium]
MNWQEVTIYTARAGIEPLSTMLLQLGIPGWVVEDADDVREFINNPNHTWDYLSDEVLFAQNKTTNLKIYLADNLQGAETLTALKTALAELKREDKEKSWGSLEIELADKDEEVWQNEWKKYYKPFKVGEKLVIKPSWEEYTEDENRRVLEIDPNSSFGTGQHYTTRLCLEALENSLNAGDKVLDLGCGSGILAISAMLLGAASATVVDIDQYSVATAIANAKRNGIADEHYTGFWGNIIEDEGLCKQIGGGYDIIVANIVADVIIAMSPLFKEFLQDTGKVLVSGIIEERLAEVINALKAAGFKLTETKEEKGWVALTAVREDL